MDDRLGRLERQIESLIEGSLTRLLGGRLSAPVLAGQLARSMEDGVRSVGQGNPHAPDQYALTMCPQDVEALLERAPQIREDLARGLLEASRSSGYPIASGPTVTLAADPTLPSGDVRVVAWHSDNPTEFTQAMPNDQRTQAGLLPKGAFLIIDGDRHFPLDRPVVNIGRRLDNQIILEDPRVSRTHAQLRVRDGQFVLFDLGSTSGTEVNGRAVHQHILRPGDVVTIADARMVYGEDPGGPPDETPSYNPPFPPSPAGDLRTFFEPKDE
jgi:hypothetical protein